MVTLLAQEYNNARRLTRLMWRYLSNLYLPKQIPNSHYLGLASTGIFIAFIALLLEFYGWQRPFLQMSGPVFGLTDLSTNEVALYSQIYTSASFVILLVGLPTVFHLVAPLDGENPYGLSTKNFTRNMQLYYPLLVIMLPVIWVVSRSTTFNGFYPLYNPNSLPGFFGYELVYLTQFFAVEFFYRGFCLFRFERIAPGLGVFIMVIPYALLHIHKPFPEAMGSIVAGLVLGVLALKSRSIWPGVLCHCTVAFSMDFFCLVNSGKLAELL